MRFHFHDDVGVFLVETVALVFRCIRIETLDFRAFDHGRIVFIGDDRTFGMRVVRVAYHAEQGFRLFSPLRMKSALKILWRAVFAVCLREHHQLHIGRIALQSLIVFNQIIDFVGGECQTRFGIGFDQSLFTAAQNIDGGEGFGFEMVE
ncbi:phosphoribosylformylglycinamidine synthase domain protein [Neisseria gonorrhoeae]|nr:phosphoribosylformylglycinamidine synthase domain protein [Neisseria gonorrhoeae]